ncbi:STAS domain-containing protein [Vannielia sp.]|uniref:STAS domain-containing protein n=1 Tax=Vannielia sp. TaxID=2813045 RepID=UPI0026088802|nr:STAS domain-containing protein [Vannielia sp.]MDF1873991.1 STAS domain-containing protein [Vannielia sp.]
MNLSAQFTGKTLLITVGEPRIDAAIAVAFKEAMREHTLGHNGRVLVDMSAVDFLDSSGLGAVVGAMKQLEPGSKMELAGLTRMVNKVFELTRMGTVFVIHANVAVALAADESAA